MLQIQCFDATTLEREYTVLTNPVVSSYSGPGGIGYGPLAVGPRWIAYSGSPVADSDCGRVSAQHLTPSTSFSVSNPNGSLVAHYAKESSKQLAAGIATLGDMGYKKLTRYCSELLPNSNNSLQSGNPGWKGRGLMNGSDTDNIGMVTNCIFPFPLFLSEVRGGYLLVAFLYVLFVSSSKYFIPDGPVLVIVFYCPQEISLIQVIVLS